MIGSLEHFFAFSRAKTSAVDPIPADIAVQDVVNLLHGGGGVLLQPTVQLHHHPGGAVTTLAPPRRRQLGLNSILVAFSDKPHTKHRVAIQRWVSKSPEQKRFYPFLWYFTTMIVDDAMGRVQPACQEEWKTCRKKKWIIRLMCLFS